MSDPSDIFLLRNQRDPDLTVAACIMPGDDDEAIKARLWNAYQTWQREAKPKCAVNGDGLCPNYCVAGKCVLADKPNPLDGVRLWDMGG